MFTEFEGQGIHIYNLYLHTYSYKDIKLIINITYKILCIYSCKEYFLQIYPHHERVERVPCDCPVYAVCLCNHVIEIPLGSVVQLVLMVTVNNSG